MLVGKGGMLRNEYASISCDTDFAAFTIIPCCEFSLEGFKICQQIIDDKNPKDKTIYYVINI